MNGAEVYFDGKYMGLISGGSLTVEYETDQTPYKSVTVSKSGYQKATQELPSAPKAGETVDVYVTLQSASSPTGTLNIYSSPSGASVYIDKKYVGTTPFSTALSPGTYGVQVDKSGYNSYSETVIISAGQTITRRYTLQQKTSYGSMVVTSEPDNAYVYVDGGYVGITAVTVNNLASGDHSVKVTAPGYVDWKTTQYVSAGSTATVHAILTPSSQDNGYIRVISYPGEAEVYLDGKYMGKTNDEGIPGAYTMVVSPGTYKVSVELTGYRDYDETVTVGAGETRTVDVQLVSISQPLPGNVSVASTPQGANVFIDDIYKGITPVTVPEVTAGSHDVVLKLSGYQDSENNVNVPPGGTASVSVTLKPDTEPKASPGFGMLTLFAAFTIVGFALYSRRPRN